MPVLCGNKAGRSGQASSINAGINKRVKARCPGTSSSSPACVGAIPDGTELHFPQFSHSWMTVETSPSNLPRFKRALHPQCLLNCYASAFPRRSREDLISLFFSSENEKVVFSSRGFCLYLIKHLATQE